MDTSTWTKWVKKIQVTNQPEADVEVVNNSPLSMIGKGRQGAVFRISDDICMKVFGNQEDCDREHYALSLGHHTGLFPRVYTKGENYIVLEHVTGVDLREYLQSQPLTPELSFKLIQMLATFKEIGFERIDHHKRQIYLQPNGELKVIDVGRTVLRDRVYPYPRKLLNSLGDEHRAVFLSHVKSMAPDLFQEWQYYIQMEQSAREVYQYLIANPYDASSSNIQQLSKTLRTLANASVSTKHLEDLLYKVFKEELTRATQEATRSQNDTVVRIKTLKFGNQEVELKTNNSADKRKLRQQREKLRQEKHQTRSQRLKEEFTRTTQEATRSQNDTATTIKIFKFSNREMALTTNNSTDKRKLRQQREKQAIQHRNIKRGIPS